MTDYERLLWVLAQEIEASISKCFRMAGEDAEWVDSDHEARLLMCRFRGMFVSSLVGEVEERIGQSFTSVFDRLSDRPTNERSRYWFEDMPRYSTPRGRAKAMWSIRIAYTHGNGHVSQINDPIVAGYLEPKFARRHFRGLNIENDRVMLFKDVTFPAIKTALEIGDKFDSTLCT